METEVKYLFDIQIN